MTTSRVPLLPVDEAKAAADEAGVPDYMAELSIFQVLLNHPRLARTFNDLLATMLWHGTLDSRLRELVIMRIGWLTTVTTNGPNTGGLLQGLACRPTICSVYGIGKGTTGSGPLSRPSWRPPMTWCARAR